LSQLEGWGKLTGEQEFMLKSQTEQQQHCEKGFKEKATCNTPLHASLSPQNPDVLLLTHKHVLVSTLY